MLGDVCTTCQNTTTECTCSEGPCLPSNDAAECPDWYKAGCVFWYADPVSGTPIVKNTRMTEIVNYLVQRIKDLEARVTTLETP